MLVNPAGGDVFVVDIDNREAQERVVRGCVVAPDCRGKKKNEKSAAG